MTILLDRPVEVEIPDEPSPEESPAKDARPWSNPGYIEITKHDIKNGVRHSPSMCPVANAFTRAGFKDVRVNPPWAYIDGHWIYFGGTLSTYIRRFDDTGEFPRGLSMTINPAEDSWLPDSPRSLPDPTTR